MIYVDTSVLAAYYCPEPRSAAAERILLRPGASPSISDLVEVEFFSVLARKIRAKDLGRTQGERIAAQFLSHVEGGLYSQTSVERKHYELARRWLAGFATPLRMLDAIHLAVAAVEGLRMVTADDDLARSARALGVPTTVVP